MLCIFCSVENTCQQEWKFLREKFLKELKKMNKPSGSESGNNINWPFFNQMFFIKNYILSKR